MPSRVCHGFSLAHDLARERCHVRVTHHFDQCRASEHADRVERDVAEQFHPDLVADPDRHGRPQTSCAERFSDLPAAIRTESIQLAEGNAIAFDVLDHARFGDRRGKIRK